MSRQIMKHIAKHGCYGIACYVCHFNKNCVPYSNHEGIDSKKLKEQAKQWIKDNPNDKKNKQKEEWDGKFVHGKFYTNGCYIVMCEDMTPYDDNYFSGIQISGEYVGNKSRKFPKTCFRPCELKIKVKS